VKAWIASSPDSSLENAEGADDGSTVSALSESSHYASVPSSIFFDLNGVNLFVRAGDYLTFDPHHVLV